eukprot:CAMPEP_0177554462 /NCGR_PEP_ID=MMETSP0369-20130122/67987_1 /TAXON_ID=447022 ORGANISM="Scrippsiella hangoei-like, Strain SHHI-4" /NCGR_SAMPLE_ID=MMETSP0369 /ASSEMBLY_ACC=CAM_ASM_000364 /LENGTH=95 /DNA_ID=CAMNT_0019040469 /DNA_START=425 /DNA_END=708 /DNA_ORIENTATION=-
MCWEFVGDAPHIPYDLLCSTQVEDKECREAVEDAPRIPYDLLCFTQVEDIECREFVGDAPRMAMAIDLRAHIAKGWMEVRVTSTRLTHQCGTSEV